MPDDRAGRWFSHGDDLGHARVEGTQKEKGWERTVTLFRKVRTSSHLAVSTDGERSREGRYHIPERDDPQTATLLNPSQEERPCYASDEEMKKGAPTPFALTKSCLLYPLLTLLPLPRPH